MIEDPTPAAARRHVAIVGPTGSGKSALALALARWWRDQRDEAVEIVSVDSMQVYRGMDIGTATPSAAELDEFPHHLVNCLDPSQECSVAWFQDEARRAIAGIEQRGRRALLVGGTGLYHRAVIDDLAIPGQFPDVAARLEVEPTEELHRRLAELDPPAAERIEPANRRRLLRALEVTLGAGRPFSSYGPGLTQYPPSRHRLLGLRLSRDALGPRLDARLERQLADGFVAEVESLFGRDEPLSRTARQALGYRELIEHLEGRAGLADTLELIRVRTRQFAVRQDRWFRRDPRIEWLDAETLPGMDQLAGTLVGP